MDKIMEENQKKIEEQQKKMVSHISFLSLFVDSHSMFQFPRRRTVLR